MGSGVEERAPRGGLGGVVAAGAACCGYFLWAAVVAVLATLDDEEPILTLSPPKSLKIVAL